MQYKFIQFTTPLIPLELFVLHSERSYEPVHVARFMLLHIYNNVSPSAALANEHPTATVCSTSFSSPSVGLTSYSRPVSMIHKGGGRWGTDHNIERDEAPRLGDGFADVVTFPESQTATDGRSGTCKADSSTSLFLPISARRRPRRLHLLPATLGSVASTSKLKCTGLSPRGLTSSSAILTHAPMPCLSTSCIVKHLMLFSRRIRFSAGSTSRRPI